jgi:hypothetical protein
MSEIGGSPRAETLKGVLRANGSQPRNGEIDFAGTAFSNHIGEDNGTISRRVH